MGAIPLIFLRGNRPTYCVRLPERITININDFEAKNEVSHPANLLIFLADELCSDLFSSLCVCKHSGQIAGKEADHDEDYDNWSCRAIIGIEPLLLFVAESDRKRIQVD